MADRFHVVTGGPGSGKSSLIGALAAAGFRTVAEAGRAVIRAEVAGGGTALPWADRKAFACRMLARDLRSYRAAKRMEGRVLFDRGIPDVIGYLRLCDLPVPAAVARAAETRRYAARIFLAPHWPAIFGRDSERRQSAAEAAATCRVMEQTYRELGYEIIMLPRASIAARVAFVRDRIG